MPVFVNKWHFIWSTLIERDNNTCRCSEDFWPVSIIHTLLLTNISFNEVISYYFVLWKSSHKLSLYWIRFLSMNWIWNLEKCHFDKSIEQVEVSNITFFLQHQVAPQFVPYKTLIGSIPNKLSSTHTVLSWWLGLFYLKMCSPELLAVMVLADMKAVLHIEVHFLEPSG